MKVLFIIPKQYNVYGGELAKARLPHIGIAYLSAYLKKQGHEVKVYDCGVEKNNKLLFGEFLLLHNVIGISLNSLRISSSYLFVNEIVAYLRKHADKKIPVILGGPHVTVAGKEVLIKTGADFAIKGEGEATLSELLKNLENINSYGQIDGLIWRSRLGDIIVNSARKFIRDIDKFPFPDYSVFKLDRYISSKLNELPITTSRGCPFDCLFCVAHLVAGKNFRARRPENVIQEIMANYRDGVRNFYISDDVFNLDIKRAEEICDLIIKNNLKIRFIFHNGLRADYLTQRLVNKLKKAGCKTIVISAESGNNDVLKAIKRKMTIEKLKSAVDIIDNANITFIVNFIIGHPTETYNKATDSLRLAKEISQKRNCATIMFFNLIPYPSTAVFEWIERNGKWLLSKDKYLDSSMLDILPLFESSEFTKEERLLLLKKGDRLHRATLLKFIFGKYFGFLIGFVTNIEFIKGVLTRLAFTSKIGQDVAYGRFLKKIYAIKSKERV